MIGKGSVFNIERYAVHDGTGIRTLVFLKGCPLSCLWCSNPEGSRYEKQLVYSRQDCIACKECERVCPLNAIEFGEEGLQIDRGVCNLCGRCVDECYANAMQFDSKEMTVEEIVREVSKDLLFYRRSSKGGVTLSGGDPLFQWDFARNILLRCRQIGIHTALETCGHCRWDHFSEVIPLLDLIFFDIKHMESETHKRLTCEGNELILSNLEKAAIRCSTIIVRIPIMPKLNDSYENIRKTAKFVKKIGNIQTIELLPYHPLGISKYEKIGLKYPLSHLKPPEIGRMRKLAGVVESEGLVCLIG